MKSLTPIAKRFLLPLTLVSAALATPAFANTFHTSPLDPRLHVGSAPSPSVEEVRGSRYYPVQSLLQSEEGRVGIKVFLTPDGEAKDAVVETSSGSPRLDEAAVQYVKESYDYDPAPGQQMPDFVRTIIRFKLSDR